MKDFVFEKNGHLSDLGISRYVDALRSGKIAELPREITAHVEACKECKKAIMQLHALIPDEPGEDPVRKPAEDENEDLR